MIASAERAAEELRLVVAAWGAGGLNNAIDAVLKAYGTDATPPSAQAAGIALGQLITDLGILDGRHPLAADVFRVAP